MGGAGNTLRHRPGCRRWRSIGTIQVDNVTSGNITLTDFTLAAASTVLPGATTANNTLNGTAGNDIINALAGNDTVNGNAGNDTISGGLNGTGGPGADVLNGNAGDDTFIWNANTATATSLTNSDGRDQINGGTEGGPGDTFVINGNGANETYNIYTLAAWDAVAGNALGSFNGRTPEIVITRGGTGFGNVIAELTEIEEIRINGVDPSGTGGGAGPATPSRSSATSRTPACGLTPSPSRDRMQTTRSTSQGCRRPIGLSSIRMAAMTPSSVRLVLKT